MQNDEILLPLTGAFGEPMISRVPMEGIAGAFGLDLPTGRLGLCHDGMMLVAEMSPEQMLAFGTALTVQARVDSANEQVALAMLAPHVRATLEALLGRRLVKPATRISTEVAGNA